MFAHVSRYREAAVEQSKERNVQEGLFGYNSREVKEKRTATWSATCLRVCVCVCVCVCARNLCPTKAGDSYRSFVPFDIPR